MKCIQGSLDLHIVLVDHLLKTKKEYKNLKRQEIHDIFIHSELDKACFQHYMAYGDFKYLDKKTVSEHFILQKTQKMMDINVVLPQMFMNFLIRKTSGTSIKNENISNKELAEEIDKLII